MVDPLSGEPSGDIPPEETIPLEFDRQLMHRDLPFVLDYFNIVDWDVLLVGDGSGWDWKIGCGWGCVVVDHQTLARKLLGGAWNHGTVGIGELMPYLQALMWFHAVVGKKRRQSRGGRLFQVHVICDNETVVKQGNREIGRDALSPIWAAIDQILRQGYVARWHWIDRDVVGLNDLADLVSKFMRKRIQGVTLADMVPTMPDLSIYNVNPYLGPNQGAAP